MSLRSQALSGFRWSASAKLGSQVITWAITLIVIRLLTPADYGLLAMAMVFVSLLAMFSELGLGAAVVQKADVDEKLLRKVFGVILVVHFLLAILLALAAPLIAVFYDEPRVIPVIRVLSLQFVFAAFAVIPDAQLQRRMEFRKRSLLDLSGAIVASMITLAVAFLGAGVWALVAGSILSQLWKTVGINWLSPFRHWPIFSIKGVQSLMYFGGRITGAQVCWMFFSQVDLVICAKLLGNDVLGFYSVAIHLASLPNQKISSIVNQVAFPTFSRMQDDRQKIASSALLGTRLLCFFALPVLWGMSSISLEIVEIVLGAKWSLSAIPLQLISIVIPLRMVGGFIQVAVQGIGRSDIVLRNAIWACIFAPFAFFIGAKWGGLTGLALAWLAVAPFSSLQGMIRGLPALGLRLKQVVVEVLPPLGAGGGMYCAVSIVRYMLPVEFAGWVRVSLLIGVGAATYGLMSLVINRKGTNDVLVVLRAIATAKRSSS